MASRVHKTQLWPPQACLCRCFRQLSDILKGTLLHFRPYYGLFQLYYVRFIIHAASYTCGAFITRSGQLHLLKIRKGENRIRERAPVNFSQAINIYMELNKVIFLAQDPL